MNESEHNELEQFAARRLAGRGHNLIWTSEVFDTGYDLERLLHLISEYEILPPSRRNYSFLVSPTAILISRWSGTREAGRVPVPTGGSDSGLA